MNHMPTKLDNRSDFLRLDRSIKTEFIKGKLTFEEMVVLIWLFWEANHRNGTIKTGYASLRDDFKGKYSKNYLNKIVLALKRKKRLWFPNQQGRRGSFIVELNNYPLSNKRYTDISHRFEKTNSRSSEEEKLNRKAEDKAEVKDSWQKLKKAKKGLVKQFSIHSNNHLGRSSNNDNENEKKNYNIDKESNLNKSFNKTLSFPYKDGAIPVESFSPQNYKQERCLNIAKSLGETDMRFLLSRLKPKNGGFENLERAWGVFQETSQKKIRDKRKYFNTLIRKLANEKNGWF